MKITTNAQEIIAEISGRLQQWKYNQVAMPDDKTLFDRIVGVAKDALNDKLEIDPTKIEGFVLLSDVHHLLVGEDLQKATELQDGTIVVMGIETTFSAKMTKTSTSTLIKPKDGWTFQPFSTVANAFVKGDVVGAYFEDAEVNEDTALLIIN